MSLPIPKEKIEKDKFMNLLVEIVIEWIQQEYNPDEIFERDGLDEWIFNDGCVRPEEDGKLIKEPYYKDRHKEKRYKMEELTPEAIAILDRLRANGVTEQMVIDSGILEKDKPEKIVFFGKHIKEAINTIKRGVK